MRRRHRRDGALACIRLQQGRCILAALGDLPHAVFDQTPSNPTEAGVRAALARATCNQA